jgi:beta-alanine degradation protein BauB
MKCSIRVMSCAALLALLALCAAPAPAQDPARVAPGMYKARLNNARVRVLEVTGAAGQKAAMHRHPDYITYDLSGGTTNFTYPKGKPAVRVSKAGDVAWHTAETHAGENTGGTEMHVILVELK